jgi:hypothetical protein
MRPILCFVLCQALLLTSRFGLLAAGTNETVILQKELVSGGRTNRFLLTCFPFTQAVNLEGLSFTNNGTILELRESRDTTSPSKVIWRKFSSSTLPQENQLCLLSGDIESLGMTNGMILAVSSGVAFVCYHVLPEMEPEKFPAALITGSVRDLQFAAPEAMVVRSNSIPPLPLREAIALSEVKAISLAKTEEGFAITVKSGECVKRLQFNMQRKVWLQVAEKSPGDW